MVNTSEIARQYQQTFAGARPGFVVRAPGRVNLIGEHTDYNDGLVMPMAMRQALRVAAGRSDNDFIAVHSTAFGQTVRLAIDELSQKSETLKHGTTGWSSYVIGVACLLAQRGIALKGGNLLIDSDVPIGGGVSSSAALEVGTALALLTLAGEAMDPVELALLARQAEHEYAHSPCGIMDQFICVLGRAGHALLLDCRSQSYEQLPFPLDETALVVMDTQVKHQIGSSEYPLRQQQCRQGLTLIQQSHPEITALRDVTQDMLQADQDKMEPVIFNRCRHVHAEIARTLEAADALRAGNLETFGWLMFDSHASLRDFYEVSCPELDCLVDIATGVSGVYGARMTGGGFGGCAIALVRREAEEQLRSAIARQYDQRFDKPAIVYTTNASDGATVHQL